MKRLLVFLLLVFALPGDVRPAEPEAVSPLRAPQSVLVARGVAVTEPKADPVPVVIFPDAPPTPPVPAPPKTPVRLASDQIYLIRCAAECVVIDGTEGIVLITAMNGPVVVRSKFTDSVGVETRTVTDKYLWIVTALSTGKTDIIVTPAGGKAIRRCLDVTAGPAPPIPPPDPPTPPVPPPDPLTASLQAAYNSDPDPAKAANVKKLAALYRTAATPPPDNPNVPSTVYDPANKTYGDLFLQLQKADAKIIPPTAIKVVRKAVGDELTPALGTATAEGTAKPIDRALTTKEFLRVATALEGIR